jgi:hypothetical protein
LSWSSDAGRWADITFGPFVNPLSVATATLIVTATEGEPVTQEHIDDGTEPPPAEDGRRAVTYLVAQESGEYIAVMAVLEASSTDLTPAEVTALLRDRGTSLDQRTVESRLAQLHEWTAVSARSDASHVRRVQDLLFRNFRYTATRQGRQVQRFYDTVLAGTTIMREIPLQSLNQKKRPAPRRSCVPAA